MSEAKAAKFKVGDRVAVDFSKYWRSEGIIKSYAGGFWQVEMSDGKRGGFGEESLTLVVPKATDFTAVNVGDRVRLTGNDEIHEFVVSMGNSRWLDSEKNRFEYKDYATVEILESAKPELPTEPGYYEVSKYLEIPQVLVLHTNARWYVPGAAAPLDIEGYKDNTFTRLTPENASDD